MGSTERADGTGWLVLCPVRSRTQGRHLLYARALTPSANQDYTRQHMAGEHPFLVENVNSALWQAARPRSTNPPPPNNRPTGQHQQQKHPKARQTQLRPNPDAEFWDSFQVCSKVKRRKNGNTQQTGKLNWQNKTGNHNKCLAAKHIY